MPRIHKPICESYKILTTMVVFFVCLKDPLANILLTRLASLLQVGFFFLYLFSVFLLLAEYIILIDQFL